MDRPRFKIGNRVKHVSQPLGYGFVVDAGMRVPWIEGGRRPDWNANVQWDNTLRGYYAEPELMLASDVPIEDRDVNYG